MLSSIALALSLSLSACSGGGPSNTDIEAATTRLIEQQIKNMALPENMAISIEINSIDNVECEKSGTNYKCTYDATITTSSKMQKEPKIETKTTTSIFAERNGDWVFVQ